jgi:phosphatidate cytidylyltransferase
MTRVLSAIVLLAVVIGTIWFLPPAATLVLALVAALLGFHEYVALARALGAEVPRIVAGAAVLASCAALAMTAMPSSNIFETSRLAAATPAPLDVVLLSSVIAIAATIVASRRPGAAVLLDGAAALFAVGYIGLPLGALVAILIIGGRETLFLLMGIIIVSDSAQYYTGRALGRHPLAPAISPKKTIEGALGGLVFGTAATVAGGTWIFPAAPPLLLGVLGATIVALGIAGDLFESLLKRSAGVKDSSALIPGHGGVLDRIDSWLFAAPVYYVFVRYLQ